MQTAIPTTDEYRRMTNLPLLQGRCPPLEALELTCRPFVSSWPRPLLALGPGRVVLQATFCCSIGSLSPSDPQSDSPERTRALGTLGSICGSEFGEAGGRDEKSAGFLSMRCRSSWLVTTEESQVTKHSTRAQPEAYVRRP